MEKSKKSILLTAAMTGLLTVSSCASGTQQTSQGEAVGKCYGVNACKGHGDCAGKVDGCDGADGCSSKSSCAGKNSCKGKGFKKLTKKQCDEKNGKFKS